MADKILPAQNPTKQHAEFGFTKPPLPPWGFYATLDRALALVKTGTSPLLVRDLDAYTGLRHFQYNLPELPVNGNIWTRSGDEWFWLNEDGAESTPPAWAPAPPSEFERVAFVFEADPTPPPPSEKPRVGIWMGGRFYACAPDEPTPDGEVLIFEGHSYQKHVGKTPFGTAYWWERLD